MEVSDDSRSLASIGISQATDVALTLADSTVLTTLFLSAFLDVLLVTVV